MRRAGTGGQADRSGIAHCRQPLSSAVSGTARRFGVARCRTRWRSWAAKAASTPVPPARAAPRCWRALQPLRVLEPMKRVGKRGEGKWQRISFEQLIAVVGGAICSARACGRSASDPRSGNTDRRSAPGLGPKANQLLVTNAGDDGRDSFLRRFAQNSFGSKTSARTALTVGWPTVPAPVH